MLKLTQKRFSDFLRGQPETGMGYWVVTVVMKDGRKFPQTIVNGGTVTAVRRYTAVPFDEDQIDHLELTHEKWNWPEEVQTA